MVLGISHITLVVSDLKKTASMFTDILGAEVAYDSGENHYSISKEKFIVLNNVWIAIMEGEPLKERTYNHIAFQITDDDFVLYQERIKSSGLEILTGRTRIHGEARSIYFYDYDNHLFELHTGSLEERLKEYNRPR